MGEIPPKIYQSVLPSRPSFPLESSLESSLELSLEPDVSADELARGSKEYGTMSEQLSKAEPPGTSAPPLKSMAAAVFESTRDVTQAAAAK